MTDVLRDSETRYRQACARRRAVLKAWREEGQPLVTKGSTGQLVEHPLVRQVNELDKLCDRLGQALARKDMGRPAEAVISATVGKSPAASRRAAKAKLRAV